MIPDKLLINLRILSKIQKNGRITRSYDGIISLEQGNIYQPVKRFITNDSRKQAVFEINSIIVECITNLTNIINSKYTNKAFSDEFHKNCESIELLLSELISACNGIENLKFTYQNDPNISSQIDIILIKTKSHIKEFSTKLNIISKNNSINYHIDDYISQTYPKTPPPSVDIQHERDTHEIFERQSLLNCASI